MLPNGVNIPMPRPFGGLPPTIVVSKKEDGQEGNIIKVQFVGEIGPITQYLELLEVFDTAGENDEIIIQIDSPGGDVYTTQLLVDRMESCKAKVTTVASGLVASAATFLWFYGDDKQVGRWGRFMFHSSLHGDWGKSLAIKETATELVDYMKSILTAEQKQGVLLAGEVMAILRQKADVELPGSVMRKRLRASADGAETPAEPVEPAEAPVETPDEPEVPAEGDEETAPAEGPAEEPVAPSEPAEAPAEGDEGDDLGDFDVEAIFAEDGIEGDPVVTPDNQPEEGGEETTSAPEPVTAPSAPEARCRRGRCAVRRRGTRCEAPAVDPVEEPAEAPDEVPEETPVEPDAPVEEPVSPEPGEEPAPAAPVAPAARYARNGKMVKKNVSKKCRIAALFTELGRLMAEGDTADSGIAVGSEPESANPDQTEEIVPGEGDGQMTEAGQTGEEENAGASAPIDFDKIFADEGVVMPEEAPAEGPDEEPVEGEPAEVPDEGGEEVPVEEPVPAEGTPVAKCGGKTKAKRRRGEGDPVRVDPGTQTVTEPGDDSADVEIVKTPTSRYW